jgi:hypothetical protein
MAIQPRKESIWFKPMIHKLEIAKHKLPGDGIEFPDDIKTRQAAINGLRGGVVRAYRTIQQ